MTDLELLELAAKAARIRVLDRGNGYWMIQSSDRGMSGWNPLANDGDSLRLAVALNMEIVVRAAYVSVTGNYGPLSEIYAGDKTSAVRRAIVRAAAEIGKAMP